MRQSAREEVRLRLLATGLRVFAVHGYGGATVREISERSKTNIAAINYYFTDKRGFYCAVLKYARKLWCEAMAKTWEAAKVDPWQALRAQIEAKLDATYDDKMFHVNWLFMRELMSENEDIELDEQDAEERRKFYEAKMKELLSGLLGEEAATLKNIKLLRYTLQSLCLFLPVQTTIENKYMRGKGLFNVKSAVDKMTLADFIMKTIRQTVDEMRRQAHEEATRGESNGDGK